MGGKSASEFKEMKDRFLDEAGRKKPSDGTSVGNASASEGNTSDNMNQTSGQANCSSDNEQLKEFFHNC